MRGLKHDYIISPKFTPRMSSRAADPMFLELQPQALCNGKQRSTGLGKGYKVLLIDQFLRAKLIGPSSATPVWFSLDPRWGLELSALRLTLKALFALKAFSKGREGLESPKINT